jgi:hypothetical protein
MLGSKVDGNKGCRKAERLAELRCCSFSPDLEAELGPPILDPLWPCLDDQTATLKLRCSI